MILVVGLVAAPSAHATVTACKKDLAAAKHANENSMVGIAGLAAAVSRGVTGQLAKAMTSCVGVTRDIESIIVKAQRHNAQGIVDNAAGRRELGLRKQIATQNAIVEAQTELEHAATSIPLPARAKKALRRLVKS